MKLIILTRFYPSPVAPASGVFIHQQVMALQQLGACCHVLLLAPGSSSLPSMMVYDGICVHHIPVPAMGETAASTIVQYISATEALHNTDWLYAHFLTCSGYTGTMVARQLGIKLAAIARGEDIHQWPKNDHALQANLQQVFEHADLLLANSSNLARDTERWMKKDCIRQVHTLYNGVDHHLFSPAAAGEDVAVLKASFGLQPDKKHLICVAKPVAAKGWHELLNAIKMLDAAFDGWQLVMVAAPQDGGIDLKHAAVDAGIEQSTVLIPGIGHSQLPGLLRACDAFVLPSHHEGMANALLEAMATGLPCIATDVGGHNEVIDNGENGLLVPAHSTATLADALGKIICSKTLRSSFGEKSREKMLFLGDYIHNGRKLLGLLKAG